SNIATATAAVNQLATSVAILGNAQAAVGRGENQFSYAINLANSQLTNLSAAESGIRDAHLATESANLPKAQIQLQAGIAARAPAHSGRGACSAHARGGVGARCGGVSAGARGSRPAFPEGARRRSPARGPAPRHNTRFILSTCADLYSPSPSPPAPSPSAEA